MHGPGRGVQVEERGGATLEGLETPGGGGHLHGVQVERLLVAPAHLLQELLVALELGPGHAAPEAGVEPLVRADEAREDELARQGDHLVVRGRLKVGAPSDDALALDAQVHPLDTCRLELDDDSAFQERAHRPSGSPLDVSALRPPDAERVAG